MDKITNIERDAMLDESAVEWFSTVMLKKLRENRYKQHWSELDLAYLINRLKEELLELEDELPNTKNNMIDIDAAIFECADVANFAMMVADKLYQQKGCLK